MWEIVSRELRSEMWKCWKNVNTVVFLFTSVLYSLTQSWELRIISFWFHFCRFSLYTWPHQRAKRSSESNSLRMRRRTDSKTSDDFFSRSRLFPKIHSHEDGNVLCNNLWNMYQHVFSSMYITEIYSSISIKNFTSFERTIILLFCVRYYWYYSLVEHR